MKPVDRLRVVIDVDLGVLTQGVMKLSSVRDISRQVGVLLVPGYMSYQIYKVGRNWKDPFVVGLEFVRVGVYLTGLAYYLS